MKYLKIQSKGQIEIAALSLMGASTKRDNPNSIGEWGSGGKYSISTMLRNNVDFKIFSGEDLIAITTEDVILRDKQFKKIVINGESTSLTTDMGGKDWDNSFAYIREIYSNALDEDENASLEVVENLSGENGFTTYFIEFNKDVEEFYNNIFDFFCAKNSNVLFSNSFISVYNSNGKGLRLFRKGILCKSDEKEKSAFHYNSSFFKINESRILSDTWDARYAIGQGWKSCNNSEMILMLLNSIKGANTGLFEHTIIWSSYTAFSEAWWQALADKTLLGIEHAEMFEDEAKTAIILPFEMIRLLKTQFEDLHVLGVSSKGDTAMKEIREVSQRLLNKVLDALSILNNTNYKERLNEPVIKYVNFSDSHVLGKAFEDTIFLSTKLDTYSVDEIAKIIIEENEHNLTGYEDETRVFQNHLFNLYYCSLTEK